jgi:hypothetical protein
MSLNQIKKLEFNEIKNYIDQLNSGCLTYEELPEIFQVKKNLIKIPLKPMEPMEEECCGSGCGLCVMDLYDKKLEKYEKEIFELEKILRDN